MLYCVVSLFQIMWPIPNQAIVEYIPEIIIPTVPGPVNKETTMVKGNHNPAIKMVKRWRLHSMFFLAITIPTINNVILLNGQKKSIMA